MNHTHLTKKKIWISGLVVLALCMLIITLVKSAQRTHIIETQNKENQEALALLEQRKEIPQENTLYIPKTNIFAGIAEGEYEDERSYLKTWRRTHTNTPDKGGNTVIVGHRYKNKGEYPLFDIDKIVQGDAITLYWEGVQYDYKVTNTLEVDLYDISVEDPTDEDILTLYACDWSGKNRLVVQAELQ